MSKRASAMRKRLRLMLVSFVTGALCALAVVGALTVPDAVSGLVPDRLKTSAAETCSASARASLTREASALRVSVGRLIDTSEGAATVADPATRLQRVERQLAACR